MAELNFGRGSFLDEVIVFDATPTVYIGDILSVSDPIGCDNLNLDP